MQILWRCRCSRVETCLNSTKQGGQTEKCFANQQCFSMFYRKTFTVIQEFLIPYGERASQRYEIRPIA